MQSIKQDKQATKKAMILGFIGQTLNAKLETKIENAIKISIEQYGITDFYFGNAPDEPEPAVDNDSPDTRTPSVGTYTVDNNRLGKTDKDAEYEESCVFYQLNKNSNAITEFAAKKIKEYKEKNKADISSVLIIARVNDSNYNAGLYNEIVQGYMIYSVEVDCAESFDAYSLRDNFIVKNVDYIIWFSNPILESTSTAFRVAKDNNKQIIYIKK